MMPNGIPVRLAAARRIAARRLASDAGSVLLDVLFTAMVVVIVGIAIFASLDSASATYGSGKARAVAAGLAEQDQERLRGLTPAELSNKRETRTVGVGGVDYSVVSRSDWITDSSGTTTCANGTSRADYMKVASTVTWPSIGSDTPIRLESIRATPSGSFSADQGSLAVEVRGAAGNPIQDVPVTVGSPANVSTATNDLGCSFFGFLQEGNYPVSVSKPDYVDRTGASTVNQTAGVSGAAITTLPVEYDRAGTVEVSFDTKVGSNPPQAATAESVSLANSGLTDPRIFPSGAGAFGTQPEESGIVAAALFPFTDGYAVYSGSCPSANPELAPNNNVSYFSQNPGFVSLAPGATQGVTVREPALNIVVKDAAGAPIQGARVRVKQQIYSACGGTRSTFFTGQDGTLPEPGMPFGDYEVCAEAGGKRKTHPVTIQNRSPAGTDLNPANTDAYEPVEIQPGTGQTGACP